MTDFKKLYKQLNRQQMEAVNSIEGPVMVIAGPGTGKTQVLTLHIANILQKTDVPAEAVLAITFTEAGVVAMRKRLAEIAGSTAYEVNIMTFHGFAQSVIQKYPESFPRIIGSLNISEEDQVRIFEDIIEHIDGLKILRPYGDRLHYLRDIISAVQNLKREGLSVEDYTKIVKNFDPEEPKTKAEKIKLQKQIDKNRELCLVYANYERRLEQEKLYDFDDMILETLRAMREDSDLLLQLQEQYQYVLVDEHQDTNNAQNRILELLMSYHDNPNLFIVGDEKQAIFRFQGASLENFNYFKNKFSGAKLITLTDNYRSTQSILDAVSAKLKAVIGHPEKPIHIVEAESNDAELYLVAKLIKKHGAENCAVLYRDNRDAFPMARLLEKQGISYHIESDLDILSDADIRKLVMIFKALNDFGNPELLYPLLYLDLWGLEPLAVHRFIALSGRTAQSGTSGPTALKTTFPEIYKKLSAWTTLAHNKTLLELFDTVVEESGLLKAILARPDAFDASEKLSVFLDAIRRLLEVKPDGTLADFMDRLERMSRHRLSIKGSLSGSRPGSVRLMTAHRSKGLEFDYVFIINAYDGHWGNRRHIDKLPLLPLLSIRGGGGALDSDDDKNLFFVAVTRAKKEVFISYSKLSLEQREQLPSQFIGELKPELVERLEIENPKPEVLLSQTLQVTRYTLQDKDFVRELFARRGFAVTHLNNYLECPWKYFFVNLLRIPKAPEAPQMYGIAVHAALKEIPASREKLIKSFKTNLALQPLGRTEKEDFEERGVKALTGYFVEYHETWQYPILAEYKIGGVELSPEITLTGNLDKIEMLESPSTSSGRLPVTVTDYKTGKPKSRNEITGQTRAADASYYRQLVFYNLLLNKHKNGHYKMKQGVIDFVEPNDSGKYKKEIFEIPPSDVIDLEKQIRQVADEIMNLKFWNKTCKEKECEWCQLAQNQRKM